MLFQNLTLIILSFLSTIKSAEDIPDKSININDNSNIEIENPKNELEENDDFFPFLQEFCLNASNPIKRNQPKRVKFVFSCSNTGKLNRFRVSYSRKRYKQERCNQKIFKRKMKESIKLQKRSSVSDVFMGYPNPDKNEVIIENIHGNLSVNKCGSSEEMEIDNGKNKKYKPKYDLCFKRPFSVNGNRQKEQNNTIQRPIKYSDSRNKPDMNYQSSYQKIVFICQLIDLVIDDKTNENKDCFTEEKAKEDISSDVMVNKIIKTFDNIKNERQILFLLPEFHIFDSKNPELESYVKFKNKNNDHNKRNKTFANMIDIFNKLEELVSAKCDFLKIIFTSCDFIELISILKWKLRLLIIKTMEGLWDSEFLEVYTKMTIKCKESTEKIIKTEICEELTNITSNLIRNCDAIIFIFIYTSSRGIKNQLFTTEREAMEQYISIDSDLIRSIFFEKIMMKNSDMELKKTLRASKSLTFLFINVLLKYYQDFKTEDNGNTRSLRILEINQAIEKMKNYFLKKIKTS